MSIPRRFVLSNNVWQLQQRENTVYYKKKKTELLGFHTIIILLLFGFDYKIEENCFITDVQRITSHSAYHYKCYKSYLPIENLALHAVIQGYCLLAQLKLDWVNCK